MDRGPIAEVDLEAISKNYRTAKKITKGRPVIAVVKADAYGHGAIEVSRKLVKEGVSQLAVAYTSEAVALRHAGIKVPLLVFFDRQDIDDYFRYNLTPVIYDAKTALIFSRAAKSLKKTINVHLKIDTGMGRMGFDSDCIMTKIKTIAGMDFLNITGFMSHFSDADLSDKSYALRQLELFASVKKSLQKKIMKSAVFHIANSAAVLSFKDAYLDAVRPGIMLYGCSPIQNEAYAFLKPAITVKTNILSLRKFNKGKSVGYGRTFITVRDSMIAVLPVGYADGYTRALSNNSDVLVHGKRAPVVGRICMDTMMVDVTGIKDASEDDEVVLLGSQKKSFISASELAAKAGTISYEILTSLGNKSRRIYVDGN
ncbi:MAG: alanine racemase [Nitrospiraceae bacterium]|nr:alanine racemase [Nitrospiraceae bacterium]